MYWAVLAREGFLAAGLLGQIAWSYVGRERMDDLKRGNEDVKELEEGLGSVRRGKEEDEELSRRKLRVGLWVWMAELAPFVVGRLWILKMRGEWFD